MSSSKEHEPTEGCVCSRGGHSNCAGVCWETLCPGEGSCKERLHRQESNALNPEHVIFDLSCFSPPKISLRANAERFIAIMWEVCRVMCSRHRAGLVLGTVGSVSEQFLCLAQATFPSCSAFPGYRQEIGQEAPKIVRVPVVIEENPWFPRFPKSSFSPYSFLVVPDPCRTNTASHFCDSKKELEVGAEQERSELQFPFPWNLRQEAGQRLPH